MEKLTSVSECYQLLQEMKPKRPENEPPEKLREILRLYERNYKVLNDACQDIQKMNLPTLYGMTWEQLQEKFSEVCAEKMLIEDCINRDYDQLSLDLVEKLQLENTNTSVPEDWYTAESRVPVVQYKYKSTIKRKLSDPILMSMEIEMVERDLLGSHLLDKGLRTYMQERQEFWTPIGQSPMIKDIERFLCPYLHIFEAFANKLPCRMYLFSNNKRKLIGLKTSKVSPPQTQTYNYELKALTTELAKQYAKQCQSDASVKWIQIHQEDNVEKPVISLKFTNITGPVIEAKADGYIRVNISVNTLNPV